MPPPLAGSWRQLRARTATTLDIVLNTPRHMNAGIACKAAMERIGWVLLGASVVGGVAMPLVSVYLGFFSAAALAGVIVAIDVLRRSRRSLSEARGLDVWLEGRQLSAGYAGAERHIVDQTVSGGQAFADHVQLVLGEYTQGNLLPVSVEQRAAMTKELGMVLPTRPAFAVNLARILTLAPGLVLIAFVALRMVSWMLLWGLVGALKMLEPETALAVLGGLALLGGAVFVARVVGRRG